MIKNGYYKVCYLHNGIILNTDNDSIKEKIKTLPIFSQVMQRISQDDFFNIPDDKRMDLYVHLDKEKIEIPAIVNWDDAPKYPSE